MWRDQGLVAPLTLEAGGSGGVSSLAQFSISCCTLAEKLCNLIGWRADGGSGGTTGGGTTAGGSGGSEGAAQPAKSISAASGISLVLLDFGIVFLLSACQIGRALLFNGSGLLAGLARLRRHHLALLRPFRGALCQRQPRLVALAFDDVHLHG